MEEETDQGLVSGRRTNELVLDPSENVSLKSSRDL